MENYSDIAPLFPGDHLVVDVREYPHQHRVEEFPPAGQERDHGPQDLRTSQVVVLPPVPLYHPPFPRSLSSLSTLQTLPYLRSSCD